MRPPGKPLGQLRRSLRGEDSLVTLFDNLRHPHYNTFIYSAEVNVLNRNGDGLKPNTELGFLYKKTHIRPGVISAMALVPEFMEALKAYQGSLTDQSVYEVLKETYKQMLADGKNYRTARDVMNKVSMDVTGDSFTWHSDIVDTHTKYGFLFKKSLLNKANLYDLLFLPDFILEIEKIIDKGKGLEDEDIYNIVKNLYFPMLKDHETEGFKIAYKQKHGAGSYKEWSYKFRILGRATRKFSETLFGCDKWHDEYEAYLK